MSVFVESKPPVDVSPKIPYEPPPVPMTKRLFSMSEWPTLVRLSTVELAPVASRFMPVMWTQSTLRVAALGFFTAVHPAGAQAIKPLESGRGIVPPPLS